jgi:hypothetical protein
MEKNEIGGTCSSDEEGRTRFWCGNLKERDDWEDPGADGSIILRWIFRKWDLGIWNGLRWLRTGRGDE